MPSMKNYVHCCLRKRHALIPDLSVPYLKAGLHGRVNFHESYREHLAAMFIHESKSWLAASLRSLESTGTARVQSFRIHVRVNFCWSESKNMAAVMSAYCEQVGTK